MDHAEETTTKPLATFIAEHDIRFNAKRVDSNPNMADMPAGSSHWRCTIRVGRRSMLVPFSQGLAITHAPTLADVLDCCASDASGFENARSFEEWASEYGSNPDSRSAERTFKLVERQSKALRRLFGDEAYEQLLWNTERE